MEVPVSESNGAPAMHQHVHATAQCHEHWAVFNRALQEARTVWPQARLRGFCFASRQQLRGTA